jgi:hypothetical protein
VGPGGAAPIPGDGGGGGDLTSKQPGALAGGAAGGNFGFGGSAAFNANGGGGGVGGGGAAGDSISYFNSLIGVWLADIPTGGGGGGFGGGGGAYGGSGGFGGGGGGNLGFGGGGGGNDQSYVDYGGIGGGAGGYGFSVPNDTDFPFEYLGAGGGGAGMGGAIFNMGDIAYDSYASGCGVVTMIDCTLTANAAQGGNGGFGGNNGATGGAGGSGFGGAFFNLDGAVALGDSTVDGNNVIAGQGGASGGNGWSVAPAGLADGGAVYNLASGYLIPNGGPNNARLGLWNSILADTIGGYDLVSNGNGTNHADVVGSTNLVESQNIMGSATLAPGVIIKKFHGVSPNLGPLQYNGGFTPTMAIVSKSSAAFSNGNPSYAVNVTNDQRGFDRVVSGRLDLGAYEVQADELNNLHPHRVHSSTFPDTSFVDPLSGAVGQAYRQPLSVRVTRHGEPLAGVLVTFTVHPGPTGAGGMLSAPGVKLATTLTVVTGADGQASVAVMANAVAGPFTVTAALLGPTAHPANPILPVQTFYLDNEAGRESSHKLGTWFLPTWADRLSWRDIDEWAWEWAHVVLSRRSAH